MLAAYMPPQGKASSPGAVLQVIRATGPVTRAELSQRTGLGRSTIAERVDALLASRLIEPGEDGASTGGRPPLTLTFNPRSGLVLAADLGATHSRVALADLSGEPLHELRADIAIAEGPDVVLDWLVERFGEILQRTGRDRSEVRGIGVGVPGPVEFAAGRPVSPPIMPGWDGVAIPERLRQWHDVPVLVDNDVNIMALGEHWTTWPDMGHLLYVKVGTGIGCGIVANGAIYRGGQGAAGDIGHIRVSGYDDVVCECGNVGCLEAVASGRALARDARRLGLQVQNGRDVVDLVRTHQPDAVQLVRNCGRVLGEVLAGLVNALNPSVIVIGGDVAHAHDQLFAGVREVIYQRSTPLATQRLQVVRSSLGDHAGVRGAAVMAIEHALSPDVIDDQLAGDAAGARSS